MDALEVTQTIFYGTTSVVIIVIGALIALVLFKLFKVMKEAENATREIRKAYLNVKHMVNKFTGKGKKE
ncbi:MAG TPA: hypothetical protein VFQ59_02990 [Candidatus Paceibacterota bacterium]|nr:hypothetical protein [Candidatus Paceibacterota bacterium]